MPLKPVSRLLSFNKPSTLLPVLDLETYSESGIILKKETSTKTGRVKYVWSGEHTKAKDALKISGAVVYAENKEADILCLSFDLRNGKGVISWQKGDAPPIDLLNHIASGGFLEAHNAAFEFYVWNQVAVKKFNWPPIALEQLFCSMAKCSASALPRKLATVGEFLGLEQQKQKSGTSLITLFSKPRNPTKLNSSTRTLPIDEPEKFDLFKEYCDQDVRSQMAVSAVIPDLSEIEQAVYFNTQRINQYGFKVDMQVIDHSRLLIDESMIKATKWLGEITKGQVLTFNQREKMLIWLSSEGITLPDYQADTIKLALNKLKEVCIDKDIEEEKVLPFRVLEQAAFFKSSAVKKLHPLKTKASKDNRIRESFLYHGATTGRFAGRGVQPQNLPSGGIHLNRCTNCLEYYGIQKIICPFCSCVGYRRYPWDHHLMKVCLDYIATKPSLEKFESRFNNPIPVIASCLRGMIIASEGMELIGSDYSAIEAVVLAFIAGEQWRMDVFNTHGLIYESSAARATGVPLSEIIEYKKIHGTHHPMRKFGKIRELAFGYQGGLGAAKNKTIRADDFMSDEEIKTDITNWRLESPSIVKLWYSTANACFEAVKNKGEVTTYRYIQFIANDDILYCRLPSGRDLTYHKPRIKKNKFGIDTVVVLGKKKKLAVVNDDGEYTSTKEEEEKYQDIYLYGGLLIENICQAIARDILVHALLNVEKAGLQTIIHVHDEIIIEAPIGASSVKQLEDIMMDLPSWCANWPIKAAGGWKGQYFRK